MSNVVAALVATVGFGALMGVALYVTDTIGYRLRTRSKLRRNLPYGSTYRRHAESEAKRRAERERRQRYERLQRYTQQSNERRGR